ncbi:methionine/alanine import family NSS transporter small subunit [Gordonia sp. HY285]|uniref:Methionine/alanine import family NSS transporter small subunit n=1 Tax=Gordonia liuliyuniae TaxID=2911517 RepID=A0ABS9INB6_9ACTN|nr:methionine/alanine import family NSS transporter small subunit [Gordonia liuliyuniae]MCF8587052.1 methionine/alanine import family NSS transporter small subunit [Gordonia liuliyuniae]MCF8609896.1 methionine/alanine import family NSS transporter small subunit [Gordonia liuliyuniae]
MSTTAIIMLVVASLIVWGGLVASVIFIRRYPEVADLRDPDDPAPLGDGGPGSSG